MNMNIAFDASDLCTNRADGTTRYTKELVKHLPALLSDSQWHLFGPCDKPAEPLPRHTNTTWHGSPWPLYWTQSRFALELWKVRPDVLFMPIQQLPIFRPWRLRTVAVVHDLAFHWFGQQYTYKDWLLLHAFTAQAVHQADDIIAVSQATADDIANTYGRTERVHVIHHGVDHVRFRPPTEQERGGSWQKLQAVYPQLKQPYIFFVGQIQPRKNLERLIDAFEQLQAKDKDLQLVIGGGHGWLQKPIEDKIKNSPAASNILQLGRVPDDLLPTLYWHAEVFALVSLYEGFGMPILEAMACGTPVVTSNISSMPEVAGEAAVLVDPNSTESITQGLHKARQKRADLSQKGLIQAKLFTWEITAQLTHKIITGNIRENQS